MIKKLSALFLFLILAATPVTSFAYQAGEEEAYRAVLLELIASLQQQIALLQEQLEILQVDNSQNSFIDDVTIVGSYKVDSLDDTFLISNQQHRDYFEKVADIIPDSYHDYFNELTVFVEDEWYTDAYVETLPPDYEVWRYSVNEEVLSANFSSREEDELIIHEFAHIVSYEQIAGIAEPAESSCAEYFERNGCPLKSSYIGQFADSFWSEKDLSRALDFSGSPEGTEMAYEYYDLHESDYVSDYAAVSPEEDFAETFAYFVLLGKPAGKNMREEKVRYLYNYPDLVKLRQIIRQNR